MILFPDAGCRCGIRRIVKADGLGMDRFINQRVDKENNQDNWRAFNRAQSARMSAMEHLVPEQMFSTEEAPANGISAVKAIQLAAAEGQKIYTITQANLSIALQQLQLSSEIKADIRNAVSAGMEVTTHQQPVNFFGSQSVGYILLDPNTGAGAYRIGGGENGAEMQDYAYSAIGIIATSVITGFTAIEAIYGLLKIVEPLIESVAKYVIVFAQVMSILDLLMKCKNASAQHLAGLMLLSMIMFIIITVIALTALPILWGILASVVGGFLANTFLGFLQSMTPGCEK